MIWNPIKRQKDSLKKMDKGDEDEYKLFTPAKQIN